MIWHLHPSLCNCAFQLMGSFLKIQRMFKHQTLDLQSLRFCAGHCFKMNLEFFVCKDLREKKAYLK